MRKKTYSTYNIIMIYDDKISKTFKTGVREVGNGAIQLPLTCENGL
ncbi:hypothetical protein [Liquorilactobacillus oeni]|nr:hypothetical protein [Liquorilactobacillus oeni]